MANPFDTVEMAVGYANARPPVHPRVMDLVRPHLPAARRALDVGCGSGLSTRALLAMADEVAGIDPAEAMVKCGGVVAPGARFLAAAAERLPFAAGSFDLLAAAGSLNYVRLDEFFPEAARVLAPGGNLVVYDFSFGRSFTGGGELDRWFERFLDRYPVPAGEARRLDPGILAALPTGFRTGAHREFEIPISMTGAFYLEYVLTGSNVAASLRRGVSAAEIRAWCAGSLADVWGGEVRDVQFRGYFICMMRC